MSTRHTHDDAATSTDAASMGAPITGPLSRREREALLVCEATIDEHLGAWVNVTNAIAEIANRRLYRETHPTFEAYLRDRWGLSRSQGHRLVLAARVAMSPVGDTIRNERQAREIAGLLDDPELLSRLVERATEIRGDRPLTAAALHQARAELTLPPAQQATAREVYRAAEWAADAVAEWQEGAAHYAARHVELLPPELWGWGHTQLQRSGDVADDALCAACGPGWPWTHPSPSRSSRCCGTPPVGP